MGDSVQSLSSEILRDAADLIKNRSGTHYSSVIIRLAFSFSHTGFSRLRRHGLVRENTDIDLSLTVEEVRRRNSACLYLPGADPAGIQALKTKISVDHVVAGADFIDAIDYRSGIDIKTVKVLWELLVNHKLFVKQVSENYRNDPDPQSEMIRKLFEKQGLDPDVEIARLIEQNKQSES